MCAYSIIETSYASLSNIFNGNAYLYTLKGMDMNIIFTYNTSILEIIQILVE